MNPDNIKKIGYGLLGVWVIFAAGLGYIAFDASSMRTEAEEKLESENDAFRRFNDAPIFPSAASIASVKSNEVTWGAWYDAAFSLAQRGDRDLPDESPSVFKQRLQSTVRRLQSLPGETDGKLSAPTFFFGFDKYLGETDALPLKDEVPMLAAQLDFIEGFAEDLAVSGVKEVKALVRHDPKPDGECARHLDYTVTFATRPAGLVKVANAIAASQRFVSVSSFSFREIGDKITPRLSSDGKKDAAQGRSRRGRGRAVQAEEPKVDESRKENRLVTDPAVNAEFDVTMTLKVYDFRTPPEDPDAKGKAKRKGAK